MVIFGARHDVTVSCKQPFIGWLLAGYMRLFVGVAYWLSPQAPVVAPNARKSTQKL